MLHHNIAINASTTSRIENSSFLDSSNIGNKSQNTSTNLRQNTSVSGFSSLGINTSVNTGGLLRNTKNVSAMNQKDTTIHYGNSSANFRRPLRYGADRLSNTIKVDLQDNNSSNRHDDDTEYTFLGPIGSGANLNNRGNATMNNFNNNAVHPLSTAPQQPYPSSMRDINNINNSNRNVAQDQRPLVSIVEDSMNSKPKTIHSLGTAARDVQGPLLEHLHLERESLQRLCCFIRLEGDYPQLDSPVVYDRISGLIRKIQQIVNYFPSDFNAYRNADAGEADGRERVVAAPSLGASPFLGLLRFKATSSYRYTRPHYYQPLLLAVFHTAEAMTAVQQQLTVGEDGVLEVSPTATYAPRTAEEEHAILLTFGKLNDKESHYQYGTTAGHGRRLWVAVLGKSSLLSLNWRQLGQHTAAGESMLIDEETVAFPYLSQEELDGTAQKKADDTKTEEKDSATSPTTSGSYRLNAVGKRLCGMPFFQYVEKAFQVPVVPDAWEEERQEKKLTDLQRRIGQRKRGREEYEDDDPDRSLSSDYVYCRRTELQRSVRQLSQYVRQNFKGGVKRLISNVLSLELTPEASAPLADQEEKESRTREWNLPREDLLPMNAEKPYENSTLYHPDGTFTAEGVREALYRSSSGIAAPNSTLHTVNVNDESRNGNPSAVGLGKYMTDVPPPPPQGKRGAFSLEEDSSMMELFPRRAQKKRRLDEPTTTQEEGSTLPFVETFAHPGDTTISSVQAPSLDQTTNSSLSQNHHNNNDIHNESSSSGRAPEKRIKIVSAVRGMEYLSSGGNHNNSNASGNTSKVTPLSIDKTQSTSDKTKSSKEKGKKVRILEHY